MRKLISVKNWLSARRPKAVLLEVFSGIMLALFAAGLSITPVKPEAALPISKVGENVAIATDTDTNDANGSFFSSLLNGNSTGLSVRPLIISSLTNYQASNPGSGSSSSSDSTNGNNGGSNNQPNPVQGGITLPSIIVPSITLPGVTLPIITLPAITTPTLTVPPLTGTPSVTIPSVTVPAVINPLPSVTTPAITVPSVPVPQALNQTLNNATNTVNQALPTVSPVINNVTNLVHKLLP